MVGNKWQTLHDSYHEESNASYVEYFKNHLIEHLNKAPDPHGEKNQPRYIIEAARGSVGKLSRIFDAYDVPVPDYEKLEAIAQKPNGLREHMQKNINEVIPVLLNEERTALHPKIIEAIGDKNYQAILKNAKDDEQEIALQFIKAVVISYGQRMLDNTKDPELQIRAFNSIMVKLTDLANEVTLKGGLPEQSKKAKAVDFQNMSYELLKLLEEAKKANINVPNSDRMRDKLGTVRDIMNPKNEDYNMLDEEIKKTKALECYDAAVGYFINGVQDALAAEPPKPQEASWFKKFLRQITGNEKLLQNADEKRYDQQIQVLSKINEINKKLNSFTEEKDVSLKSADSTQEQKAGKQFGL